MPLRQPEHGPGSTRSTTCRRRETRRLNVIHKNVLLFCQHLNLTDTQKKKREKKKIISPNLFERNDEIYCCRPLGDLFSSLRRVKCVLAFLPPPPVLLFKCMDREWHPPHYSLKITCDMLSWTRHILVRLQKYTCIKAVLLLTHAFFVNTSVCLFVRWHVVLFQHVRFPFSVFRGIQPLLCVQTDTSKHTVSSWWCSCCSSAWDTSKMVFLSHRKVILFVKSS